MNTLQKIVCCAASVVHILSAVACDESESSAIGSSLMPTTTFLTTTADPDEKAPTDAPVKEVSSDSFIPDGNSGTIKWLEYYDLEVDGKSSEQYKIFTSELYGGKIEYLSCANGCAYFEKMGILIAAGDSSAIVSYEWKSFPYGMSKNLYESLDGLIDLESPLWSGMADIVDSFAYGGKSYCYPYRIATNYALNYNREALSEYSLPGLYDLYMEGSWTWDRFK